MTQEEFNEMVARMHSELKMSDDDIMKTFYDAFISKQIGQEDYELMVAWLGYELNDDFYKDHGLKRSALSKKLWR